MTLAIVIPVHGDDEPLDRLLASISAMSGVDEIVISASEAWRAVDLSQTRPTPTVVRGAAGRGAQLNRGRHVSDADVLWFLHADASPPAEGPAAIRAAAEAGSDGGYCRFRFEGVESRAATRLAALINWRAARGVAYGDQGLWFKAEVFDRYDGFDAIPLFEEVTLVRRIKSLGRFTALPVSIGIDPRRWRQSGWIKRTLINRALAIGYTIGVSPHTLARWYSRH